MPDPFLSSQRKLAWAKKHISQLNRRMQKYIHQDDLYTVIAEPHPSNPQHVVTKMRLLKQLPIGLSEMTGNIVDDLRASLDHAMYGLAVGAGCCNPTNAYFPFSREAANFEANLKGRCKDVPKEIYPLLRSYKPYRGGSEALWALNQVCGANKHALILPIGTATVNTQVSIEGRGFWSMPQRPIWDSVKNEMELCVVSATETKLRANFGFAFYIAFGEIDIIGGKPVIPVLNTFVEMVGAIIREIETEALRLGLLK
jgi:hypothetical protein